MSVVFIQDAVGRWYTKVISKDQGKTWHYAEDDVITLLPNHFYPQIEADGITATGQFLGRLYKEEGN